MKSVVPLAVKITIGVLAIFLANEVLRAVVEFPVLAANLTASSMVTLESIAALAGLAALILVLQRKALGRWISIAALGVAYLHHVMSWLSKLQAGDERFTAEDTGAAMFEAVLFFAFISLIASMFFSGTVRAYFSGTSGTAEGS